MRDGSDRCGFLPSVAAGESALEAVEQLQLESGAALQQDRFAGGAGAVLRAVERGEKVIVTFRGQPVAEMTAPKPRNNVLEDNLFGIWKDNDAVASVDEYMGNIRKGRFG